MIAGPWGETAETVCSRYQEYCGKGLQCLKGREVEIGFPTKLPCRTVL